MLLSLSLEPEKEPEKDAVDDSVVVGFSVTKEGHREGVNDNDGCMELEGIIDGLDEIEGLFDGVIMVKEVVSK